MRTTTTRDGSFTFDGVPDGVWYVTPLPTEHGHTTGRWVRVTEQRGTKINLTDCPECAPQ
jgi:hypothetical protein